MVTTQNDRNKQEYVFSDDERVYLNGERIIGMEVKLDKQNNNLSLKSYRTRLGFVGDCIGIVIGTTILNLGLHYCGIEIQPKIRPDSIVARIIQQEVSTTNIPTAAGTYSLEDNFSYVRDNSKGKAVLRYDTLLDGETAQEISDLFDMTDTKDVYKDTTKYNVVFANGKYVGDTALKEALTVYVVAAKR